MNNIDNDNEYNATFQMIYIDNPYCNSIQKWVEKFGKFSKPCVYCQSNDWVISIDLLTIPVFDKNDMNYPVVPFTCSTCGNTRLIHYKILKESIDSLYT